MRAADRLIDLVTGRSRLVVAVFLVFTLLIGSGVGGLAQSSSLDQFQTDSVEADKQAYIDEHYGAEENTTTAQLIVREENALSKESLIASLELQAAFRENETINGTLADEPFGDLADVVATAAIRGERADELETRSEALDARGEALDERRQRLEAQGEELASEGEALEARGEALEEDAGELEADAAELEERQARLEADRTDLEARGAFMAETLNETGDLRDAYDDSEITETEYETGIADLDAAARERLPDGEYAAFAPLIDDVAGAQAELNALDARFQAGEITQAEYEDRSAEPAAEIEAAYDAIEGEVLAPAGADLAERGEAFETDASRLEERQQRLGERGDALADDRAALESRSEELDAEGEALETDAAELEDDAAALEDDSEAIAEIDPDRDERIAQLQSMNQSEIDKVLESVLSEDAPREVFAFLPTDYEPGSTSADARAIYVTQTAGDGAAIEGEAPPSLIDSQLAMDGIVEERFDSAFVFGSGIISDEIERSLTDSLGIVLPLALGFVVCVLAIAYRDPLDIVLGGVGILVVLLWTFGFMGWIGIAFNQIMIAVPVLLVGLSIDYAIHVFMRHRERREESAEGSRRAMAITLSGLGLALIWVTATAVIGFLSNLVSPVGPIREFGIVSAVGIVSALLVFGLLIPASKVELDAALESRGYDRRRRAFGTGGGPASDFLALGGRAARRAPWAVIVLVLVLTAGAAYGAAGIDTSFSQEDFIADDPADWMQDLPEPLAVGQYDSKANLEYVNENFLREDTQTEVLVEGDITRDDALSRLAEAESRAAESDSAVVLSSGEADLTSPLSVMESVAEEDEEFNETFAAADTTGDGVPDENIEEVYDALFAADENAAQEVVYRTDSGEYESFRLVISIEGSADTDRASEETRAVATILDGDGLEATATSQLIVFGIVEQELLRTVVESMLVTLVAVFAFLMLAYRWTHGSAVLGAVTLVPIVLSVAWILGTMYLLEIPFNVMTGTITSLTIGLGVAYNIHMTERFLLERERDYGLFEALDRSVRGTGGALLGSAATTVGGFGVLVFAILPPLQQFGLITGLTIVYAFLASVFVLPSLLAVWARYLGPDRGHSTGTETATPAGTSD
ncbi:MMPL family transporter [Halalkalicoccus jeotgali]|uniref:Patched family protein n=1 Tax=Halalkalicoccus jeotgali (strain DSM 18796 / CECT 7217 / JCM 14584 / KCTC 4019 / B3) TaxID=795797 RepID=D8J6E9_HALJB|nr:MMPL family transporter [Halalkalicoccus jeotgali]ADJ15867.1 Patched family protein [Halalkalicoccus jeotgali B3]ELY37963.1 Patched family protein [Halalkalicoccus jeotgali B3]